MPDIRADEPEAREPERPVLGDGEGSAPSADGTPPAYGRPEIYSPRVRAPRVSVIFQKRRNLDWWSETGC
jgi:hypothetical protein